MSVHERLVRDYQDGIGIDDRDVPPAPDFGAALAAALPVAGLASGSIGAVIAAANRLRRAHGLDPVRHRIDPRRVAAAFAGERLLRIDGAPVAMFADLSGFFPTFDGWVRTHANYPHHRARLLAALHLPADAAVDLAVAQIAMSRAADIEDAAAATGAIAVRVRTEREWAATPQARAAAAGPLVATTARADARGPGLPDGASPFQPLRGIRVLDMTRVIAGPVATRTLALLGADVLRIDPPGLPEIPWQFRDTCQGKRTTVLDLRRDRARVDALLDTADVLVTGYRPGALEHAGLTIRPGLVHGRVSAWGELGPWGGRRGFDSIVQAATGIAIIEGAPSVPSALPAQALDHASGYLLAAGVIDALVARAADGIGRDVRVSLARTASWLLAAPERTPRHPAATEPDPHCAVAHGNLITATPALAEYPDYPAPARRYGCDRPAWSSPAPLRRA
ncbi:CoA transferase [Nocardia cyriacigeorgica]|uniref:CoA transferase n=1 Tax=Nocardia cyriacigeorgica TaxID=135487 RepID=UPI002458060E|nr:CoA transferase [Nocardia cyriacigeorgica]